MHTTLSRALLFLATLAPPAAAQQEPGSLFDVGTVRIRGTVHNAQNPKVVLANPEIIGKTEHVTYLDDDGRFELEVEVLSAHDSQLRIGGHTIQLFTAPRDSIELEADVADLPDSLRFSGDKPATQQSLNVFFDRFLATLVAKEFGRHKRDMPAAEFLAFAGSLFQDLEAEVDRIVHDLEPEAQGEAWMRNYLRYRLGEDLVEYGTHHPDGLPADYFDFDPKLLRRGPHDLECSQYYDDFVDRYHVGHRLSSLAEFPSVMAQFRDQTEHGLRTTFEFLDRNMADELAKRLVVTQLMTRFLEADHETADALFEDFARIVPDATSQTFIKRRIAARFAVEPLVASLADLEQSELLGELFQRVRTDHAGKVIYMDIWATWCGACLNTFPHAKRLAEELEGTGVQPIYLCINSDKNRWERDAATHGLPTEASYWLTRAQSRELSRLFRYNAIPRYVIFDSRGNIVDDNAKQPTSRALQGELLELANR